jgi:deltex-like protein
MPSGTLYVVLRADLTCDGHEGSGSFVVTYDIESGTQKNYHVNPGETFRGTRRVAYLPDNEEGRKLLKRLKYAFQCGLTFTVGTSLTTGRPNSVTWASVHHKTSLSGGPYGFPDLGYFINANEELDALDVPDANDL